MMLMTAANIYCVLTLPGTVPSALCVVTHAVHVNGFAQCQAQSTRVHMGVCVVIIGYLSSLVSYSSPTPSSGSLRALGGRCSVTLVGYISLTESFLLSVIASQWRTDAHQLAEYERAWAASWRGC